MAKCQLPIPTQCPDKMDSHCGQQTIIHSFSIPPRLKSSFVWAGILFVLCTVSSGESFHMAWIVMQQLPATGLPNGSGRLGRQFQFPLSVLLLEGGIWIRPVTIAVPTLPRSGVGKLGQQLKCMKPCAKTSGVPHKKLAKAVARNSAGVTLVRYKPSAGGPGGFGLQCGLLHSFFQRANSESSKTEPPSCLASPSHSIHHPPPHTASIHLSGRIRFAVHPRNTSLFHSVNLCRRSLCHCHSPFWLPPTRLIDRQLLLTDSDPQSQQCLRSSQDQLPRAAEALVAAVAADSRPGEEGAPSAASRLQMARPSTTQTRRCPP